MNHRPRHLVVSLQDLPHTYYFLHLNPYFSPLLLKILEFHVFKIHITCHQLPIPRSTLSFFSLLIRNPLPLRVGLACFRCFRTPENSRPPLRRRRDGRATKRGIFSFVSSFVCFGDFLTFPSYNIFVNKPYIVNKIIHSIRDF